MQAGCILNPTDGGVPRAESAGFHPLCSFICVDRLPTRNLPHGRELKTKPTVGHNISCLTQRSPMTAIGEDHGIAMHDGHHDQGILGRVASLENNHEVGDSDVIA